MAQTKHWRSQLFSALGTGFEDDSHVQDGIHLRWSSDPRLGLPLDPAETMAGVYRVYYLHDGLPSLGEMDLPALQGDPTYPIHSNLNPGGAGMDTAFEGGSRFYKAIDPDLNTILSQYFALTHWLNTLALTDEEKGLLNYLNGVLGQLQPELYDANWGFEIGEVCAVDAQFKLFGSDEGEHAWVRGFDRRGRLVAEDWVGRDQNGFKETARLRSPNIYAVRIEPVEGMPAVDQQEICWIFCDEYSRAGIWRESGIERYFELKESAYPKERVTEFFYGPFKAELDWSEVTNQLLLDLIQSSSVQELPLQADTYQLFRLAAELAVENPADQQTFPNLQMPVLASLIQAAVDPAMANILGLYAWGKADVLPPKRDYKVEAYLPFFNQDNLVRLQDQVLAMLAAQGVPFNHLELEKLSGFPLGEWPGGFTRTTALCGLVLYPEIGPKPAPHQPNPFATEVKVIDLLSQENADQADIFVNSRLKITRPPFTTTPYLQPVAYEVERKLSGTEFANVIDLDDKPDPLDEIGILPAVYIPKAVAGEDYWELRDDFRLPVVQEDTVQYRLTAFDIFGRPSDPHEGSVEDIQIPCYEPLPATSLTAQVNGEQDDLNLELYFAVSGTTPPLHTVPQALEITIHPVNALDPAPVDEITWPGSVVGRTFMIDYLADGTFLDEATLTPGCASLAWNNGQLVRTPLPGGNCDDAFPLDPATLSLTVPMSPLLEEGDTGYRLYRLQTKIGEISALGPGLHRWAVRVRIEGMCESGAILSGRDVITAVQHIVLPPPPAVEQPLLVAIPESTYPDRQGDAYYNLDLSQFIPAAIANSSPMVNIYSALLPHLTDTPEAVVAGDYFAPGGDVLAQNLGRSGRPRFQRVNETPVVYSPDNRFYQIPVRGDLEAYHVVGVIGCNTQLDEKDWRKAGIMLFKTPKPVPAPRFYFGSVRPAVVADEVYMTLEYHADFEMPVPLGAPPPRVQIIRYDISTGSSRLAGEATGVWDYENGGYHFTFTDTRARQWRRYRYEATLLFHAGKLGQTIKAEQTAVCTVLAPETGATSPFTTGQEPTVTAVNGVISLAFTFMAGDFNFSLTKALADNTTQRVEGRLYEGKVQGVPNAGLTIQRSAGWYTLSYLDTNTQPGTYTLRLWQGQKTAWPQKLEVS